MKNFPELLEELRTVRQISKKDLAIRARLTPGYVSLLTRGERTAPSLETVEALADALNLDKETRISFFKAAGFSALRTSSDSYSSLKQLNGVVQENITTRVDWGEAPDVGIFYGRQEEQVTLEQWTVNDRCRVAAILGIGGIGKTSLTVTLTKQIKERFDCIFWRSLQDAPPIERILRDCIHFLSNQKPIDIPEGEENQLPFLLELFLVSLRKRRCLMVLDNFDSVLQSGERAGEYRKGYEGYSRLIQRVGETNHLSCLILTSREKPREIVRLESDTEPVRSLVLSGIRKLEGQELLKSKGIFGSDEVWAQLVDLYSGNPLALKLVSEPIRELFRGDIAEFLKEGGGGVVGDLHDLLDQQFGRLSEFEEEIMYWLAIEREAVSLKDLQENVIHPVSRRALLETLDSLRRRSMIETSGTGRFTLQPVIMEYVTSRFVEEICKEIDEQASGLFDSHTLILAQAKDYVRNSQTRLILEPIAEYLLTKYGKDGTELRLKNILSTLRQTRSQVPGYAAGNILNLLVHLHFDLHGYDFSQLMVWQAYLQGADLSDVNFAYTNLAKSVFTDTFGSILSVALSPNGELLAAGTDNDYIRLWEFRSNLLFLTFQGHTDWVRSVAFSPDGKTLVSGSEDQTIRLWEVSSGQCLGVLQGHTNRVRSVAFSPDGKTVASGSDDQTVRLWEVSSGQCLRVLQGHTLRVYSVAFNPDGKTVASGSEDQTIRLWEVSSGQCLRVLQGHGGWIWSVAFSPDGKTLVSGNNDGTIEFWDLQTGESLKKFRSDRPYERMKITNVTGITEAQKATLRALGAIED